MGRGAEGGKQGEGHWEISSGLLDSQAPGGATPVSALSNSHLHKRRSGRGTRNGMTGGWLGGGVCFVVVGLGFWCVWVFLGLGGVGGLGFFHRGRMGRPRGKQDRLSSRTRVAKHQGGTREKI